MIADSELRSFDWIVFRIDHSDLHVLTQRQREIDRYSPCGPGLNNMFGWWVIFGHCMEHHGPFGIAREFEGAAFVHFMSSEFQMGLLPNNRDLPAE